MSIANLIATTGPIYGLTDEEKETFNRLWRVWTAKLRRNMLRRDYYDQRNVLKDLGIAIPPHLTDLELVLGWPAKSVDVLARRCKIDKFVTPGSVDADPFGVSELWLLNEMHIEAPQTIRSALKYSCSFLSVTEGMEGEPDVLISSHSALYASGIWDYSRRRLRAFLTITDIDDLGRVVGWAMFVPGVTIRAMLVDESWVLDRQQHTLDRLPVEALPFDPDLDRPFGKSRISRAVMGLSDSALRTLFRMEIHAEFFSSPQRYAMGADESMFVDEDGEPVSQWEAIIGRVWAAGRDPDTGDVPTIGQFAASSPQPHTDQLRTLSAAFCAESSIPLSELGVVHDANPTSAEAIEAAERPLVQIARDTHDNFGPRIARAMVTAVQIRDNLDTPPAELLGTVVQWRDPDEIPQSSAGDFIIKLVQAMPWMAESKIPLEQMGWDAATVERAWADKRKANVSTLLQRLPEPEQQTPPEVVSGGNGA